MLQQYASKTWQTPKASKHSKLIEENQFHGYEKYQIFERLQASSRQNYVTFKMYDVVI